MFKYTIIIEKAGNNYSAYCPDLPGCIATGSTTEETIERMKEAIKFHIEGLKKEGLKIPEPTTTAVSVEVVV
ncbi:type II toxin-antitoxin system HicB family antitoxin [Archaeoglobales archaeon]|nr:MAG: type II toxin-antitoxin system HicB family antitoxin [Archaeoglobales archaeon]